MSVYESGIRQPHFPAAINNLSNLIWNLLIKLRTCASIKIQYYKSATSSLALVCCGISVCTEELLVDANFEPPRSDRTVKPGQYPFPVSQYINTRTHVSCVRKRRKTFYVLYALTSALSFEEAMRRLKSNNAEAHVEMRLMDERIRRMEAKVAEAEKEKKIWEATKGEQIVRACC